MRSYTLGKIQSRADAVAWLDSTRKIKGVAITNMILGNLGRRSKRNNIGISTYAINNQGEGAIVVSGTYNDKPFSVGVDMESLEEFIAIENRNRADIETLERELGLIEYIVV